jgi:hypothetical protein
MPPFPAKASPTERSRRVGETTRAIGKGLSVRELADKPMK